VVFITGARAGAPTRGCVRNPVACFCSSVWHRIWRLARSRKKRAHIQFSLQDSYFRKMNQGSSYFRTRPCLLPTAAYDRRRNLYCTTSGDFFKM
jgi:hypothetical protein